MRPMLKYLGIAFGSLIALCAIALAVVLNLDFNDYKYLAEGEFRERTGRDLEIRGRLDVDLSFMPSVTVTDVRIANAAWGSEPDMAHLDHFSATLDLNALIFDQVVDIHKVELRGLDLLVEKNREGGTNLEFRPLETRKAREEEDAAPQPRTPSAPASVRLPILRDVDLKDVRMRYNDLAGGQKRELAVNTLAIGGEGPFQPLSINLDGQADRIPVTLTGELGSPAEMLNPNRIWTVDLAGNLAGTVVTIAGGIDEPAAGRGINIVLSADTPEVGSLSRITEPLAGQTVPSLGPLKASVLLSGDADGQLSANDILVVLGRGGQLQAQIIGSVGDVMLQKDVDIKGNISVPDVAKLSDVIGQPVPALGALKSDFTLRADGAGAVALEGFSFELSRDGLLRVAGRGGMGDVLTQRGLNLQMDILVPDVKALPPVEGVTLPDAGRLEAAFALAGDVSTSVALRNLSATLSRGKSYQVTLNGGIADLLTQSGIDLGFGLEAANLAGLSALAQTDLPQTAPVKATGRLKGGGTDAASVDNLAIKIGESDISGHIRVVGMASRPNLSASLSSNTLRLQDIDVKAANKASSGSTGGSGGGSASSADGAGDGRVIPKDPIDLAGLRMADATIDLSIAKLLLPTGGFRDGRLTLALKDGLLTVEPISLTDDKGGTLTGQMTLDARREAADFKLDIKADGLEVSNLMRLAGQPGIIEGPLRMAVAMTSSGRSPRELAAGLNGQFNAAVTEGFVNSDETRRAFGRATQVVSDLLLGNSKEKRIPLYCFVADYEATNGVVNTKSLVLDTKVSTILSSGDLNLGTEKLDLTVKPTRKVLGIGTAIPVRVQGTFAKPNVYPDPALAALGIGGMLLGAPLIPLELLGSAILANDNDSPCVNLRPENQQQLQNQTQEQDPKKQLEDAGKKALEGLLKNLIPQQ